MIKLRIISLALCLAVFMLMSMEGKAEFLASLPQNYSDALAKAKTYSEYNHLSKQAIFERLVSEDRFPEDAAKYAINNLITDYKANALAAAKFFNSKYGMSKLVLYNTLTISNKFTADEANYAIDTLKIDFTANAIQMAQYYSSKLHLSKKRLCEKLIAEHFTALEAKRAADSVKKEDYKLNALEKARYYRSIGISKEDIFDILVSDIREAFTIDEAQYASANL